MPSASPAPSSPATRPCPNCTAAVTGRFCAECGAAVDGAVCAGCRSVLSPGAKFCHRCGTPAGTQPAAAAGSVRSEPRGGGALPWAVAAIALLALIAMVAGQRFNVSRGGSLDGSSNALPVPGLDMPAGVPAAEGGMGAAPGGRAPDISQLTPRERADRLFDRVMRLAGEGKVDSLRFFSPMALGAYQELGELDLDLRYDYGRVAEVAGEAAIARAQADSILRDAPTHLLGLVLAQRVAMMGTDSAALREADRRLLQAEPAEMPRNLVEYQRHQADIQTAIAEARQRNRR